MTLLWDYFKNNPRDFGHDKNRKKLMKQKKNSQQYFYTLELEKGLSNILWGSHQTKNKGKGKRKREWHKRKHRAVHYNRVGGRKKVGQREGNVASGGKG